MMIKIIELHAQSLILQKEIFIKFNSQIKSKIL